MLITVHNIHIVIYDPSGGTASVLSGKKIIFFPKDLLEEMSPLFPLISALRSHRNNLVLLFFTNTPLRNKSVIYNVISRQSRSYLPRFVLMTTHYLVTIDLHDTSCVVIAWHGRQGSG